MIDKVGIVGYGLVGRAVAIGLAGIGRSVHLYDIKFKPEEDEKVLSEIHDTWMSKHTNMDGFLQKSTDIVFICVPTLYKDDGSCDTSIVEKTVDRIISYDYRGIIVIKSTVEPLTTQRLIDKYKTHKIAFVPEFLTEKNSIQDFIEEHDLLIIGTESTSVFEKIKECHGSLPKRVVQLKPTEAEFAKYFNNCYNATLVTFANSFYELCKQTKTNYSKVLNAVQQRPHISKMYLDCWEELRGYSGPCLVKDLKAIVALCKKLKMTDIKFFKNIDEQNRKFKKTVWPGMRPDNSEQMQ